MLVTFYILFYCDEGAQKIKQQQLVDATGYFVFSHSGGKDDNDISKTGMASYSNLLI